MGLIDWLFGKPKSTGGSGTGDTAFQTVTAYQPTFTSWGGQIYESELVRAAVDARARHVSKLQYAIRGTARQKLITATKTAPNEWYTWAQFLERCSNIYDVQNNLFIVPVLDKVGDVTGYFPVLPSSCTVVQQAHPEAPKKESCRSMTYGTFLFLTFQSCSQFVANIILFVATQHFTLQNL